MFKEIVAGSYKPIRKKDLQRNRKIHIQNIFNAKSSLGSVNKCPVIKKKRYYDQDREEHIDHENQILLHKITNIFTLKKRSRTQNEDFSKSLNISMRRKQMQDIQQQNFKFLKRIKDSRSSYQTSKLMQGWSKTKEILKKMSNFQEQKPNSLQKTSKVSQKQMPYEIYKRKTINNYNLFLHIKMDEFSLKIQAQSALLTEPKIIQLDRLEAIQFLKLQCKGRLDNIFNRLWFDGETLCLVSQNTQTSQSTNPIDNSQISVKEKKQVISTTRQVNVSHKEGDLEFKREKTFSGGMSYLRNKRFDQNSLIYKQLEHQKLS